MGISVVMIAKNEEANIGECLSRVRWADEIVVIDSGSTDRTAEMAREYTAKVFDIPFENFAKQKNEAISRASQDWIFLIDADERVGEELAAEIRHIVSLNSKTAIYSIRRETFFMGKRLRFSGTRCDYPIRLFPRGMAHYTQPVHEYIVSELPVKKMNSILIHYSTRDVEDYNRKLEHYVMLEVDWMKQKSQTVRFFDPYIRSSAKFIYQYIVQLGILDGKTGLIYAWFSSYYVYLKYKKYAASKKSN